MTDDSSSGNPIDPAGTSPNPQATPHSAIVLAAGRGTRLRPLTDHLPKALVEVAGQPLIHRHLHRLALAGVTNVVVNLHHHGDQIRASVGSGERFGLQVHYSEERELLETGGGVFQALPALGPEPFLCLSADVWTAMDLRHLGRPLADGMVARLPLVASSLSDDFGFAAEPPPGISAPLIPNAQRRYTFASVSLLSPALFASAKPGHFLLRDLLFPALRRGELEGELFAGPWFNIGTSDDLAAANAFATGSA